MKKAIKIGVLFIGGILLWWTINTMQGQTTPDLAYKPETPLLDALKKGDIAEANKQLLYNVQDKVAERDSEGNSPLHVAVYRDLISNDRKDPNNIVPKLIEAGANPTERNFAGNSVLHFARTKQMAEYLLNLDAFKNLYARAAISDLQNKAGDLPIHLADTRDEAESFLLHWPSEGRSSIVNYKDDDGNTPIFFARTPEAAEYLQSVGARINDINNDGQTPLMFVVTRPTFEFTKIPGVALERTEVEVQGKLQADSATRTAMTKYFIEAGRGQQVKSYNGELVDFFAVQSHKGDGNTVLHDIVLSDFDPQTMAEIVRAILGASTLGSALKKVKNNKGKTALDLIKKRSKENNDVNYNNVIEILSKEQQ